jgi:hypothetical protein
VQLVFGYIVYFEKAPAYWRLGKEEKDGNAECERGNDGWNGMVEKEGEEEKEGSIFDWL